MYNETLGKLALLGHVHRRQPDLLPAALPRPGGHAAPLRRLSRRLRRVELRLVDRLVHLRRRRGDLPLLHVGRLRRRSASPATIRGARAPPRWSGCCRRRRRSTSGRRCRGSVRERIAGAPPTAHAVRAGLRSSASTDGLTDGLLPTDPNRHERPRRSRRRRVGDYFAPAQAAGDVAGGVHRLRRHGDRPGRPPPGHRLRGAAGDRRRRRRLRRAQHVVRRRHRRRDAPHA